MKEGIFTVFHTATALSEHETALFKKIIDLKFDNSQKVFHVVERQVLLKVFIGFYCAHLECFKLPKLLDILKEIFS